MHAVRGSDFGPVSGCTTDGPRGTMQEPVSKFGCWDALSGLER